MTTGHASLECPIWAISSFSDAKSSSRLVRNVARSRIALTAAPPR